MSNRKITKKGNKSKRRMTKLQRQRQVQRRMKLGLILLMVLFVLLLVIKECKPSLLARNYFELDGEDIDASKPDIDVELLTVNPYSRPGNKTGKINGIVVHYTANPGATAIANRNYFEGLKDTHETKTSSNFIVGLDGEIIQCVPTWEIAYASNERNSDTVSIECCHPDESGEFNKKTYRSAVQLCAWLCLKFDLSEKDVIRHYDVTGKNCPKYFVENEDAWKQFRQDIKSALEKAQK
ncbi:MAG: N-acetylmuramoyl-L-alanine amidase family protein [Lachnospiraceae bacterium]